MAEEKLDWQVCMKPATEKDKVLIQGYLVLPNRGKVEFTTLWTMEEFLNVMDSVVVSVKELVAQIGARAASKT